MNSLDFTVWLDKQWDKHPMLKRSNPKTLNELAYVLRMSEYDFSLSFIDPNADQPFAWTAIPSVKECFIPTRDLALHVTGVAYTEEEYEGQIYRCLDVEVMK